MELVQINLICFIKIIIINGNTLLFMLLFSIFPFWIRIRIQERKLMQIHSDPDPQPW